jgi:hypothetical protein
MLEPKVEKLKVKNIQNVCWKNNYPKQFSYNLINFIDICFQCNYNLGATNVITQIQIGECKNMAYDALPSS